WRKRGRTPKRHSSTSRPHQQARARSESVLPARTRFSSLLTHSWFPHIPGSQASAWEPHTHAASAANGGGSEGAFDRDVSREGKLRKIEFPGRSLGTRNSCESEGPNEKQGRP